MPPLQGHDYFTELPLELLQEIASHLPLFHKLKLRTIFSKQQEDVVVKLLGNGIKNLYVSPTTASLDRFANICKSSFFQQHVKEIWFVPYAITPAAMSRRLSFRRYRDNFPQFSEAEALMSFGIYNSVVDEHRIEFDSEGRSRLSPADMISHLEAGFVKMTQVDSISIQCISQDDSMNGYALHHGKLYHKRIETKWLPAPKALGEIKTAAMETAAKLLSIRHVQALVTAVRDSGITIRHFALGRYSLGRYHRAQLPFDVYSFGHLTLEATTSIVSSVTELTISCENSKSLRIGETSHLWRNIAESASKIKHLTIYPYAYKDGTSWLKPGKGAEVIDHFLVYGHYRHLHSLDLKGRVNAPQIVNLEKLEVFLFKHRRTLREVRMDGLRVSTPPEDAQESDQDKTACDSLRVFATSLRMWIPDLQTFELKIASKSRYPLYGGHWMAGSKMTALAAEMGIEMSKDKRKTWDFGKVAT